MAKQLYAVLAGINGYNQFPLNGCVNDINAVERWLNATYADSNILHIKKLSDEVPDAQPTRDNIINAFSQFDRAKDGDTCLFYFCGHGVNLGAPAELKANQGSGAVQAMVCKDWDPDKPGTGFLIDKELSFLIWKATLGKPQLNFVVITDCCHSGTNTRGIEDLVRQMDILADSPPVANYYGYGTDYNNEPSYQLLQDPQTGTVSEVIVKRGGHIHIAAAQDTEVARELHYEGEPRGAFSFVLVNLLTETAGNISYSQIADTVALRIKNLYYRLGKPDMFQHPRIEVIDVPGEYIHRSFLSDSRIAAGNMFRVYYDNQYGWCIAAGILEGISVGDVVRVFTGDSAFSDCSVIQAGLLFSQIAAVKQDGLADLSVKKYYSGQVLTALIQLSVPIARWQYIVGMNNPTSSITGYTITVQRATGRAFNDYVFEDVDSDSTFNYISDQGRIYPPVCRIAITNNSAGSLFFSIAYLGADHSITTVGGGGFDFIQVEPGHTQSILSPGYGKENIELQNEGEEPITEYLKLFISTNRNIPLDSLQQMAVDDASRGVDDNDQQMDDWATVTVKLMIGVRDKK